MEEIIKDAREQKKTAHITFFDLEDAFGSVPHSLIQETLKKNLDNVEAMMNDAHAPVTRERMAALQTMINEVLETVRGPVSDLYDQRVKEDPTQVQTTTKRKQRIANP